MPSASTKTENKAPPEAAEPMKQVLQVVEKKVRNLEKRKGKLDQYRKQKEDGEILNKDQKDAVGKYDSVITNLEFARELQKLFDGINADAEKYQKKQAKREKLETRKAEVRHFQEILNLQGLLNSLGKDSVRDDFKVGRNGALQLDEAHLEQLDRFLKLVSPVREGPISYDRQTFTASDHFMSLIEGREKSVAGTSYKELKDLLQKIRESRYFDGGKKGQADKNEEVDDEKKDEGNEKAELAESTGDEAASEPEPISLHQPNNQMGAGVSTVGTLEADSSVSAQLPQSQIEPGLVGMSQQPIVADPTTGTVGTTSQALASAPAGFHDQDDSFFTTTAYTGQRAFTDIVSSVQGTFNFLQDSHIESSNSPHMVDPAVVAAQPMTIPNMSQTPSGGDYGTSSLLSSDRTSRPQTTPQTESASQQQQLESTYSTGLDYGQQSQMSNLQNTHNTFGSEASSGLAGSHQMTGLEQAVPGISNTPNVPPSIPLPNQTSMGGNANMPDSQANISQDSQEKKHYPMNPNAVTFQSMYSSQGSSSAGQENDFSQQQQAPPQTQQQQSHTSSGGMDNNKYNNDYQGSSSYDNSGYGQSSQGNGNYGNSYNRGGRDGSRGSRGGSGRGGRGGGSSHMSNGYSQRGVGRSSGPFNNSRGGGYNGNSRGGGRGAFQGYPPRSDYQPEGGYQGYSNGYTSSSSSFGKRGGTGSGGGGPPRGALRGAASGGGMRGGPRGGGMRGGSGSRGGYGGQRSGPPQ